MTKNAGDFQIVPFPKMRRFVTDFGWVSRRKHIIRGLVEVDVTEARRILHAHRTRTGESISFTAFVTACLAQAVTADRRVQALRDWRGRLIIFDDVDVGLLIERSAGEDAFPLAHVLRAAQHKSVRQLHDEIRAVQALATSGQDVTNLRRLTAIPAFLRRALLWWALKNPHMQKRNGGTVALTAVGMFGQAPGWGLSAPVAPLVVTVGSIARQPGVIEDRIEPRDILHLTLEFDHDIIDGAPAARFSQRLIQLLQEAYGLGDWREA